MGLRIIYVVFLTILIIILSTVPAKSCEVFNWDTGKCETYEEQNLTVRIAWKEFW